jgi:N-acetylglucosaminyl-diphospho-decaprenol L-rhamnosyltransferase
MHDLAVIIVSTSEAHWLRACLPSLFAHVGDISVDVIVVDNESADGTRELVEDEFPAARVVSCRNHGFSHANNRALMTCDARYVLFLNPDTEVLEGTLEDMVARMDAAPEVGLAGAQQATPDGPLFPTIRRFPNAGRAFMEAIGCERLPFGLSRLGNRELDMVRYEREIDCDWTSGSYMLARREALESAGWLDERFFLYADEVDLALRIRKAGWVVRHLPHMRIVHHANKMGFNPRGYAQFGYSANLYSRKHFSPVHGFLYRAAIALRYGSRWALFGVTRRSDPNAALAMRRAFTSLRGGEPPYQPLAPAAVRPRARTEEAADVVR